MRLCIVSNGPSANIYTDAIGRDHDVVAGVNWTVEKWEFDWWVFCDWKTFRHRPIGEPRLFITPYAFEGVMEKQKLGPDAVARMEVDHPEIVLQSNVTPPLIPVLPPGDRWNIYSGLAAVGLAWFLGAREVTVYGADMGGTVDHTGREGGSRSEQRWEQEHMIWASLMGGLKAVGVTVIRVMRDGERRRET